MVVVMVTHSHPPAPPVGEYGNEEYESDEEDDKQCYQDGWCAWRNKSKVINNNLLKITNNNNNKHGYYFLFTVDTTSKMIF